MIKIELEDKEIAELIIKAQDLTKELENVAFELRSKLFTEIKKPASKTDKQ